MDNKNIGESSKLIKPLFVDGNFNRDGKRIRAKHVKDISCDGAEYSLWISAGSNEKDYPEGENDTHYLYALIGEYLVPCKTTDYRLEIDVGYRQLVKKWYGSREERDHYFDELRKCKEWEESSKLISARITEENACIKDFGKNEQAQAEYFKSYFDSCIENYIEARDAGGKFADFTGALILGEIERCQEIADVLRAKRQINEAQRMEEVKKKKEKEEAEQKLKEQTTIIETEKILMNGGKITSGEMIVKIADKHNVEIPIRTRGWILNNLVEFTVSDSGMSYRYRKHKNGHGSDKVYDIISAIRNVIVV